ncbi:hypothetical protein [Methanobrevibacter sp.]|uniref:hypothetical protein n=1 Tax=Methanobrevibacter sp. TaxID=66852 RepID=UPI0038708137
MNRATKITLIVLSVFIVGITMAAISAEPEPVKKFEDKGYKWEIDEDDWNHMVKDANAEYRHAEAQGRAIPIGYSHQKNVTVTKDGIEYNLVAFAIKNHKNVRCEVRGLREGYLVDYDTVAAK